METSKEVVILVHIVNNRVMKFVKVGAGLYIWRPEFNSNLLSKQISSYSFLSLVSKNKLNFSKREINTISAARKLYINLGIPDYPKFFGDSENNRIRDMN